MNESEINGIRNEIFDRIGDVYSAGVRAGIRLVRSIADQEVNEGGMGAHENTEVLRVTDRARSEWERSISKRRRT